VDIKTKNTGKTFYQVPNDLAAVLLELGMVERVNQAIVPPEPPAPRWGVTVNRGGSTCIVLTIGTTTQWYEGDPAFALTCFQRKDWLGRVSGPETPANIAEMYMAQMLPSDWLRLKLDATFAKGHAQHIADEIRNRRT
jgi:hypothetical protein